MARSLRALLVGAGLLLSAACTSHAVVASPTPTPQTTLASVTPVSPTPASPTVSSNPTSLSTTSSVPSTTSRSTRPPTTSRSTRGAPTTVPPEKRFTWKVDSTVPTTATAKSAVDAAIPIYQGFMTTYDESLRAPQAQSWEAVMKKYAADSALSIWRSAWQSRVQYGGRQTGTTSASGRVTAAGSTGINMRVCMNFIDVHDVDKAGKPIQGQKGFPTENFAWLLTIEKGKVVDLVGQTPSGKPFSC